MFGFEKTYAAWMEHHIASAKGERLRRLVKKHGYGEKLLLQQAWWPVVGNFDLLYPEYEFVDSEGKYYYFDFAYLADPRPTALESDGFGTHARDLDRDQFSWGLDRQNEMVLAEWNVLRFSHDKLKADPLACQQKIRRLLETFYAYEKKALNVYQREIYRRMRQLGTPVSIEEACAMIGKKEKFTRRQLHSLVELEVIEPAYEGKRDRIHDYRIKVAETVGRVRSL